MAKQQRKQTAQRKAPYVKCRLCGEMVKITRWRKHLSRFHANLVSVDSDAQWRDYYVLLRKPRDFIYNKCKCRLCHKIISSMEWEYHLICHHKLNRDELRPRDFTNFYIKCEDDSERANRKWYNPNSSGHLSEMACGAIVNGPPPVRIIYNPIFSNRKKF